MVLDFSKIKNSKNLLAFSGGVDSTALFFLLLEKNISFDIAIVNYNLREQSKDEVKHALDLAKKYDKKIYLKELDLSSTSNFEKTARDIRYSFFEQIIKENSYETLITAHQLNDRLEWFFMQLSKGAGLIELLGMDKLIDKENYKIFRPLLDISKKDLQDYLDKNGIKYFIDSSNFDEKYRRNYFRKEFSNRFLAEFEAGVINSFKFLEDDLNSLDIKFEALHKIKELEIFENLKDDNLNLRVIDKSLKRREVLLSQKERIEILKQKELTISHKINIAIKDDFIYICPKVEMILPKEFKELCRVRKIPKNIRAYLFKKEIVLDFMK
jgi:tRNA(Ile)-lysidine synthase